MLDFIVLGSEKCGTNSLRRYLAQHPLLYPEIHGHVFLMDGRLPDWLGPDADAILTQFEPDLSAYAAQIDRAPHGTQVGEVATLYLYDTSSAARIAAHCPAARLIAILRDPADRAYSNYVMMRRDEREPLPTFEEALAAEPARIRQGWGPSWHYAAKGFYHRQLSDFLEVFPRRQVKVTLYDDFLRHPATFLADLFRYLEVGDVPIDTSRRYNVSGIPRSRWLQRVLQHRDHWLRRLFVRRLLPESVRRRIVHSLQFRRLVTLSLRKAPPMRQETRRQLVERYDDDIRKLETLLDRDLSSWRTA